MEEDVPRSIWVKVDHDGTSSFSINDITNTTLVVMFEKRKQGVDDMLQGQSDCNLARKQTFI
jgi:hypothetical protein